MMVEAGRASVRKRWERARLLAAGGEAGGRRGCQTHENERFSCSFFLQGEETSNRRLSKRAGHLDMVGAAGRTLDSAMRWDCGRRQKLRGRCCLGCCCRDRQLEADGGGFRSFGEFAEISRLLWLQGEARSGQVSALRRCRNLQWWGVDLRLPQHYRNRLEKFDFIRGFATQSTSKGTRTKFRFCERGGGAA